jgi:hypothetical protein
VSTEANACPQCGYPISKIGHGNATPPPHPASKRESSAAPASRPRKGSGQAWLLVILLGVLGFVIYRQSQKAESSSVAIPERTQVDEQGHSEVASPPVKKGPIVDEQVMIKEDFYHGSIVDLKRDATVTIKIDTLAGPAVETWVLDADGFQQFEKAGKSFLGGKFIHFSDFRMMDVRKDQRTARLHKGRYYFVIDNTDQGVTKPPANFQEDTATIHLVIEAE